MYARNCQSPAVYIYICIATYRARGIIGIYSVMKANLRRVCIFMLLFFFCYLTSSPFNWQFLSLCWFFKLHILQLYKTSHSRFDRPFFIVNINPQLYIDLKQIERERDSFPVALIHFRTHRRGAKNFDYPDLIPLAHLPPPHLVDSFASARERKAQEL